MSKNIDYGKIIKDRREQLNIKQKELAKALFISRQTISNWENNVAKPDKAYIGKLCKILKIEESIFIETEYEEMNYKVKKHKKKLNITLLTLLPLILVLTISLIALIIIILNQNKIEVYTGNIESDTFKMSNTIFIKTNEKYALYLGSLLDTIDNKEDYDIHMFYITNDKNKLIIECSYQNDIIISQKLNEYEYFDYDFNLDETYIEFINKKDSNKTYTFHFKFQEENFNPKIFYKSKPMSTTKSNDLKSLEVNEELIKKCGYKKIDRYSYSKKDDGTYILDLFTNELKYSKGNLHITYSLSKRIINVIRFDEKNINFEFTLNYNIDTKKTTIEKGFCNDYQKYIDFILKEKSKIFSDVK